MIVLPPREGAPDTSYLYGQTPARQLQRTIKVLVILILMLVVLAALIWFS